MPYNGSGTYTRSDGTFSGTDLFEQREANGNNIDADLMDAAHNDIATALTNAVCKDGQSTMTGNLKMGTNKITGLGNPTAAQDAVTINYLTLNYKLGLRYFSGLAVTHAADAEHDMTIATGYCRDYTDTYTIQLGTAVTKRIDATWAAGTTNGGCSNAADSGVVQASTCYGLFLLSKSTDPTDCDAVYAKTRANALADTNIVSAGYDICRLIDYAYTDGSANILKRLDDGQDSFLWDVIKAETISESVGSRAAITTQVPPFQPGRFTYYLNDGSAKHGLITQSSQTATTPSATAFDSIVSAAAGDGNIANIEMKVDGSRQVYHQEDVAGIDTVKFFTRGYKIDRTITDLV